MGISKTLQSKFIKYSPEDKDRLVRMGWEDRATFDSIRMQFGLFPSEFVQFMRFVLEPRAFKRWRRRVSQQGQLKNEKTRGFKVTRFKCSRQSVEGLTKGWK